MRNASPCSGWVYCARFAPVSGFQASIAERTRIPLPGFSTTPVTTSVEAELAWTAVSVAPAPSLPIEAVVVKCTSEDEGLRALSAGIVPGVSFVIAPVRRSIVCEVKRPGLATSCGPVAPSKEAGVCTPSVMKSCAVP